MLKVAAFRLSSIYWLILLVDIGQELYEIPFGKILSIAFCISQEYQLWQSF